MWNYALFISKTGYLNAGIMKTGQKSPKVEVEASNTFANFNPIARLQQIYKKTVKVFLFVYFNYLLKM